MNNFLEKTGSTEPHNDDEATRNEELSTKIAQKVEELCGEHDWTGDKPFEITSIHPLGKSAYKIAIRKGSNEDQNEWITLMVNDYNTSPTGAKARSPYFLESRKGKWRYLDPYLEKYGQSNLPELQDAYDKLCGKWEDIPAIGENPPELPKDTGA